MNREESPEQVLQILGTTPRADRLRRIVAAWPQGHEDLNELAGMIGSGSVRRDVDALLKLGLIYEDGTVNEYATKALRKLIKDELGL